MEVHTKVEKEKVNGKYSRYSFIEIYITMKIDMQVCSRSQLDMNCVFVYYSLEVKT